MLYLHDIKQLDVWLKFLFLIEQNGNFSCLLNIYWELALSILNARSDQINQKLYKLCFTLH